MSFNKIRMQKQPYGNYKLKSILGSYVNTDDIDIIKGVTQPLLKLTLEEKYTINILPAVTTNTTTMEKKEK